MRREIDTAIIEKRNKLIVDLVNKGYSSSSVGLQLGLTRERIGQIYFDAHGKSIRQEQLEKKLKEVDERVNADRQRKNCKFCGREFVVGRLVNYCSGVCRLRWAGDRRDAEQMSCAHCSKKFHPLSSIKYNKNKKTKLLFCSRQCYYDSKNLARKEANEKN